MAVTIKVVSILSEETIKKALKNFNLTETEIELYLLLAKNQPLKGGEIAKILQMHKAQVYRSLKSLHDKSIVESTLESPIRFTALPFESVLDFFAKVKRQEAAVIDESKQELIEQWNKISKTKPDLAVEKFTVLKGKHKINSKTLQMIKDTKNQLSIITTILELAHANQIGFFDAALNRSRKSKIQFHVLTEIGQENLKAFDFLFRKATNASAIFAAKTPELGSILPPRMIIRDNEEMIFYITPKAKENAINEDEICLWTNCKALVQAFNADFETAWEKATNILEKVETNKSQKDTKKSLIEIRKHFDKTIQNAKNEILILTSIEGLLEVYEKIPFLIERQQIGVAIKILAPIVSENLNAAKQLSTYCEVRHVPIGYSRTTIIDGIYLFQVKNDFPLIEGKESFKDVFYSNESEIIQKTKNMFNNIWEKALAPSSMTLRNIVKPPNEVKKTSFDSLKKIRSNLQLSIDEEAVRNLTEKDIVNQIIYAQAYPEKNTSDKIVRHYGTAGQADNTSASFP